MLALKIIGAVILICFLIGRIRIGLDFQVMDGRMSLSVKVFGARLQLIPSKKKKEKAKKERKAETKQTEGKKQKSVGSSGRKKKDPFFRIDIYDIKEMLSKVIRGIRKFRRGLNCDRLRIDFTASSWDPYITARMFSYVNAFLSVFAPLFEENNRCRDCFVRTQIDFNEPWPKLDLAFCISLRIGAAVGMVFSILFGVLWVFIKIIFRFLRLKLFDKEEYDFRMNQQEGPVAFFRRIIREEKERKAQPANEPSDAGTDSVQMDTVRTGPADNNEENEERNASDGE
ncbi:MAG: hypothetical protein Q4F31_08230 [Eubacteriales bacterium]|nr:hypothetical protein [Eubacteriales bacterium]